MTTITTATVFRRSICSFFTIALIFFGNGLISNTMAYPDKPVRLIVPQSPGSAGDVVGRLLAQHLGETLGQAVVVENRAGANGILAATSVAKEAGDGYTLMLGQVSQLSFNEFLYKNVGYSGLNDFTYISPVVEANFVLVASKKSGLQSIAELKEKALKNPDALNYASVGPGSMTHLAGALLTHRLDISLTHVAYKGTGPALISIQSGETDVMVSVTGSILAQIKAGEVTPLAILGAEKVPDLPEVATSSELGLTLPIVPGWYALVGPAGMPQSVVDQLADAMQAFLTDAEITQKLRALYLVPMRGSGEDIKQRATSEQAYWGDFIQKHGLVPN